MVSDRPDSSRIIAFAAEQKYTLMPWQEDMIRAICAGDHLVAVHRKRNGVDTLRKVIREFNDRYPHPGLVEHRGLSLPME